MRFFTAAFPKIPRAGYDIIICWASFVSIAAALIANKTVFRGKPVPFVMECQLPYALKKCRPPLWEKARDFRAVRLR